MLVQNPITLAQYTILGPLGAGAMGEVYRARDSKLGREVAIKVLRGHFELAEAEYTIASRFIWDAAQAGLVKRHDRRGLPSPDVRDGWLVMAKRKSEPRRASNNEGLRT